MCLKTLLVIVYAWFIWLWYSNRTYLRCKEAVYNVLYMLTYSLKVFISLKHLVIAVCTYPESGYSQLTVIL